MSSYDELKLTVKIENIKEVYYDNEFQLDLEETLELMKKTPIEFFDEDIVFYGEDFKVILEPNYYGEPEFIEISLKRPSSSKIHKPFTVDAGEKKHSKEYGKNIPFMTEQMIEDEEIAKQKAIEEEKRRDKEQHQKELDYIKEKENFTKDCDNITNEDLYQIFKGGTSGENAYITIPYFPNNSTSYHINDENFLTPELRKAIDFIGYAVKVNGQFRVFAKKSLYLFRDEGTPNELYYHEVMNRLKNNRKIIPILGIATKHVSSRPKDILTYNLEDIKDTLWILNI